MQRRLQPWIRVWCALAVAAVTRPALAQYDPPAGGPEKYLQTIKISNEIYVFKPRIDWTHGNGVAILGPDGVFFIDTFIQFNYAEEAIRRLRAITPLPVRYVLNTHFHTDHVMGNAVFKREYPECRIIAQDDTASRLEKINKPSVEKEGESVKGTIALLQSELDRGTATKRNIPLTGRLRRFWEWQLQEAKEYDAQFRPERWVPVDITFDDTLTMRWGDLTLHLIHMADGGHSPSDVIVWIPETKVLVTGDLDVAPTPYATGPNIPGMIVAIPKLIAMDPAVVIPGHGEIQHDTSYLQLLELAFTTYRRAAEAAIAKKVPYATAVDTIAFPEIDTRFIGGDEVKRWAYREFFVRFLIFNTYQAAGAPVRVG